MLRPLYLWGKCPRYPLDRRLGGPRNRSGRGSEEKNSHPLPGIIPENLDRLGCSLVAILTDLSVSSCYFTKNRNTIMNES
jgi:hypothetical protein